MNLILIGPPGVGKGTQAALLHERLGLRILSTGVIFRQEIEAETDLGRLAKRYIDHGRLVPNGVTIEMVSKRMRRADVLHQGFVLDGFPRSVEQAEALEEILEELDAHIHRVVELHLETELLVKRLSGRLGCTKCGAIYHATNKPPKREGLCDECNSPLFVRSDDTPEAIRQRLEIYEETTKPVVEFYREREMLTTFDAHLDPEELYNRITESVPA